MFLSEPASLGDSAGLRRMFGSLSYSMFTLFQFMTFDSWAVVARQRPKKLELTADNAKHMGSSWISWDTLQENTAKMGYLILGSVRTCVVIQSNTCIPLEN